MSIGTETYVGRMIIHRCCTCGVPYGLDEDYNDRKVSKGGSWKCPNGHSQVFCESEEARLRKKLGRETHLREQAESEVGYQKRLKEGTQRKLSASCGQITKIKNRADKGMCPHCRRFFGNVHDHIQTQHKNKKGGKKCQGSKR